MIDFLRHSQSHIFVDELADELYIEGEKQHHLANVLRVKVGDKISAAFDGKVRGYKVVEAETKTLLLHADSEVVAVEEPDVHLAVSLFKLDRLEWGIAKAIETGARSITIGTTERSSFSIDKKKKEKVQQRLNSIAESACSQSRRAHLAEVRMVGSLYDYVAGLEMDVLICEPDQSKTIDTPIVAPVTFVIGPEGGFTKEELDKYSAFGHKVQLSPYILRAETAMAIAPTLLHDGSNFHS